MDETRKAVCVDALAEAAKLLELAQVQLQRARAQCSGQVYDRADLIAKRAFELKVKSDWLRYTVLGKIGGQPTDDRFGSDRRMSVDRRIVGMQKRLVAAA